jgi:MFS family permease
MADRPNSTPSVAWILLAAAGAYAVTMGVRNSMGLYVGPINSHTGLGLASVSLAFAVGQLFWGLTQPFAGYAADRWGPGRVLVAGILLSALGTALTPLLSTTAGLILVIGLIAAGGAGMAGPSVLMSAVTRLVSPAKRGMANGIVNAGSSFGQFAISPLAQALITAFGWAGSLAMLAFLMLVALPAAWVLRRRPDAVTAAAAAAPAARETTRQALARAFGDRSYRLLAAGFFTCGFHVAFLATHLPGFVASCQLPPEIGAWSLAVIGLFNIAGSLGIGWLIGWRGGHFQMKHLLSVIYGARAVAVLIFVFAPKTPAVMLVFAAVMGLTYLSTVPPTAGLVARFFGVNHMATLFGILLMLHQAGAFLGAWLGGKTFEASGSYDWMWYADILLAAGAALVHLPIRERAPAVQPA